MEDKIQKINDMLSASDENLNKIHEETEGLQNDIAQVLEAVADRRLAANQILAALTQSTASTSVDANIEQSAIGSSEQPALPAETETNPNTGIEEEEIDF